MDVDNERMGPRISVVIPCRDGEDVIGTTVRTLCVQKGVDIHICVGDDHSLDRTPEILKNYAQTGKVKTVRYPKRNPRNYHRLPILLNMAMKMAPESDYYMVSGDDMAYPRDYCERVIKYMEEEKTSIASGYSIEYGFKSRNSAPGGSGRIYTREMWKKVTPFYPNIGWESGALYDCLRLGGKLGFYPVPKSHLHDQGPGSTITWGYAGYLLGTPILFTFFRVLLAIKRGTGPIKNSFMILVGHAQYMIWRPEIEYHTAYVWNRQFKQHRIGQIFKSVIWKFYKHIKRNLL